MEIVLCFVFDRIADVFIWIVPVFMTVQVIKKKKSRVYEDYSCFWIISGAILGLEQVTFRVLYRIGGYATLRLCFIIWLQTNHCSNAKAIFNKIKPFIISTKIEQIADATLIRYRRKITSKLGKEVHQKGDPNEWKTKQIRRWNNDDVLHWINSLDLNFNDNNKIMHIITDGQCNGRDIVSLETSQDIGESFDILNDKALCDRLFELIKHLKSRGSGSAKEVNTVNGFKLNVLSQGDSITLDKSVQAHFSVTEVKKLYKIQSGVAADLKDIHFYSKSTLLSSNVCHYI